MYHLLRCKPLRLRLLSVGSNAPVGNADGCNRRRQNHVLFRLFRDVNEVAVLAGSLAAGWLAGWPGWRAGWLAAGWLNDLLAGCWLAGWLAGSSVN